MYLPSQVLCDGADLTKMSLFLLGYVVFGSIQIYTSQDVHQDPCVHILTTFLQYFGLFAKGRITSGAASTTLGC